MTRTNTNTIATLMIGVFLGCSPSVGHTSKEPREPNLCDLDGGKWCTKCGPVGSTDRPVCPSQEQIDSGWLCCANGACIAVPLAGDCTTGTVGWCSNYTTTTTSSGIEVATCHDPQP